MFKRSLVAKVAIIFSCMGPFCALAADCHTLLHPLSQDNKELSDDLNYVIEWVPEFQTVRQFNRSGRIPEGAKRRMLLSHGNGAKYSNSDSLRQTLRNFADTSGQYKASSNAARIRNHPNFALAAAEAIDLPGHRYGAPISDFATIESTSEYLAKYLQMMKSETPHLPLTVFTRSSSASLYFKILKTHPGLIDGLILMSPTVPVKEWVLAGTRKMYEKEKLGEMDLNHAGLEWIGNMLMQSIWDATTLTVPTLILTGSADWEVVDEEREFLKEIAANSKNVEYYDFKGAGHDVFRDNKQYRKESVLQTYKLVQDFLKKNNL